MLHPEVRAHLDEQAARGRPPYTDLTPEQGRAQYRATVAERWAGVTPAVVGAVEDLTVPGPGGDIPVRLYRPPEPHPGAGGVLDVAPAAIAWFHGGGWVLGDLDTSDGVARGLCAATGALVAAVDYRQAPEHPYPAAAEDCAAATAWLAGAAGSLGADPERVAVAGDSAGGNLAVAVALAAAGADGSLRAAGGPRLCAQVLLYPTLDAALGRPSVEEHAEGFGLTAVQMRAWRDQYLPDRGRWAEPAASPLDAPDLSGLPPALVVTAEHDILRDEGEAFAVRLRAAGVPTTLVREDGLVHGFLGTPVVAANRAATARTWDAVTALLAPAATPRR